MADRGIVIADGLGPLDAACLPEYVLGFPVHLAITLRVDSPSTRFKQLPLPGFFGLKGAIGVVLTERRGGTVRARIDPHPRVDRDLGSPPFALGPSETRRILLDLGDVVPPDMPPGAYILQVTYASRDERIAGPPLMISWRTPTADERRELDSLKPERERAGSWSLWTKFPAAHPDSLRGPFDRDDPLRYCRVLRYLQAGDDALSAVDVHLLDALDSLYLPESVALRAELWKARGNQHEYDLASARIRQDFPGLLWWLGEIENGRSPLAFEDERRRAQRTP